MSLWVFTSWSLTFLERDINFFNLYISLAQTRLILDHQKFLITKMDKRNGRLHGPLWTFLSRFEIFMWGAKFWNYRYYCNGQSTVQGNFWRSFRVCPKLGHIYFKKWNKITTKKWISLLRVTTKNDKPRASEASASLSETSEHSH